MRKPLLLLLVGGLLTACQQTPTPEERMAAMMDSINQLPSQDTVITADEQPKEAIIEDSDLDSIAKRLDQGPLKQFMKKKWVNLQKDSTGFYISHVHEGQNPYIEITEENGVYLLVLGEMQSVWYAAIVDFKVTQDDITIRGVNWNNENKVYSSRDQYQATDYTFSFFDKENNIIKNDHDQYYVESTLAGKYRVVDEDRNWDEELR